MATKPKALPPAEVTPTAAYVVQHTPLLHDGVLHMPGDAVELTETQALAQGSNVAPAPTTEPNKE